MGSCSTSRNAACTANDFFTALLSDWQHLLTGLGGGAVLGLAGACSELVTLGHKTALLVPFIVGCGKALTCALVGSVAGTLVTGR